MESNQRLRVGKVSTPERSQQLRGVGLSAQLKPALGCFELIEQSWKGR